VVAEKTNDKGRHYLTKESCLPRLTGSNLLSWLPLVVNGLDGEFSSNPTFHICDSWSNQTSADYTKTPYHPHQPSMPVVKYYWQG
jgi:hypothetical protein